MPRLSRPLASAALAVALLGGGVATASALPQADTAAAVAATHGPDPTADSIGKNGSYTVKTTKVARTQNFAGGTVYYPENPQGGEKFAGVVTMPGYMEPGSAMNIFGNRLASHGFVVLVADPLSVNDQPASRAVQLRWGKYLLATNSEVGSVLETSKIASIGHSMGGGGALEAAAADDFAAVVALHPWHENPKVAAGVTEPALVVGGTIDPVAPMGQHAMPLYQSVAAQDKGMLVRQWGTHFAALADDAAIQGRILSFLKLEVDGDARYKQFYCAPKNAQVTLNSPICSR